MSDFASIIGGAAPIPILAADPDGAGLYFASSGTDWAVDLGAEADTWLGSASTGDAFLSAGEGNDIVLTGAGDDFVDGETGNDVISTAGGRDNAAGGEGNDALTLGKGNDTGSGDGGNDTVSGDAGNDFITGGSGDDVLDGGDGDDVIFGQSDDDTITGGAGDDTIFGQSGDDFIAGGAGDDQLWGGEGADVFYFDSNFGSDVIRDFGAGDQIWLASNLNGSGIGSAQDLVDLGLITGSATETIITIGSDSIRIEGQDVNSFIASINSLVKVQ